MTYCLRRSVLYMPGSNARALEKRASCRSMPSSSISRTPGAGCQGGSARTHYPGAAEGGSGSREVLVRINEIDTAWWHYDLAVAAAGPDAAGAQGVGQQLREVAKHLVGVRAEAGVRLGAMMETPLAMLNPREIAAAARDPLTRLAGFVMGTNDLAKDTRARIVPGRAPMLPWLMTCVAAARAYGLDISTASITSSATRKVLPPNAGRRAISASTARR